MPTDFEKRFGDYGDLTDPLGLAPASMAAGQYPNRPEEDPFTRYVRLVGKGATLGLAQGGQTPIEAENIPEHIAEFAGSIPSTVAASAIAGPLLGMAVPGLARLAPVARSAITAGTLGSGLGSARALQTGDITNIPEEAAWWAGSDIAGHGLFKGAAKLFGKGKGAKIASPEAPLTAEPPRLPLTREAEVAEFVEAQKATQKGNVINRLLNPDDISTTVPGERQVIPSSGPRTMLPPKEIPPHIMAGEGPAVRSIKVGEDEVNFEEIPDLVLGGPKAPRERMVELHRAEAQGTTGETFIEDRLQALKDAKTVGGYLKTIEVPESELARYGSGGKYKVPHVEQKRLGMGEQELEGVEDVTKGLAKIRPPREGRPPADLSLVDEAGNVVAQPDFVGPSRPLPEGRVALEAYSNVAPDVTPFGMTPMEPKPIYQPVRKPSLDGFVEKPHENPIHAENLAKPLKEAAHPATGLTMVAPKTKRSEWLMDAVGRTTRNVEPPISAPMRDDLVKPLNKAKLDHGVQVEQFRTSNLIKKSDEEIDRLTQAVEGSRVVKPLKFVTIEENPLSQRVAKNLERQGMTPAEMTEFVKQKNAQWDAAVTEKTKLQIGTVKGATVAENKQQWLKGQIAAELKRRGPC